MAPLSPDIDQQETLVRAIKSPWHLDRSKRFLTTVAFTPPPGSNELSVIRQVMGDQYCHKVARQVSAANYKGMASAIAGDVHDAGAANVVDSPVGNFPGHADVISFEREPLADNPHPPEVMKRLLDYYEAMVEKFTYFADPDRKLDSWSGPELRRSA